MTPPAVEVELTTEPIPVGPTMDVPLLLVGNGAEGAEPELLLMRSVEYGADDKTEVVRTILIEPVPVGPTVEDELADVGNGADDDKSVDGKAPLLELLPVVKITLAPVPVGPNTKDDFDDIGNGGSDV